VPELKNFKSTCLVSNLRTHVYGGQCVTASCEFDTGTRKSK
jgi:hypothetical protein